MRTRFDSALALAPLLATAALFAAGGCASSGPYWSREDQGAAQTTELRERVASLEAQLAEVGDRNAALQAQVDALERDLERTRERTEPLSTGPAPGFAAPEAPLAPGTRQQIEQIEQSDLADPALPGEPAADAALSAEPGPEELYERSLELLEQDRLTEAEAGFVRFLAANPESDLADNAQFWLAESALRRKDVAAALAGFRTVVEKYPAGNKVPDALLKVGACLAALGDGASAATVYRELVARFPDSAAGETARQRLGAP